MTAFVPLSVTYSGSGNERVISLLWFLLVFVEHRI